ncbi:hypothetical protein ONE63_008508 [Megalurothrips usitatus]|uniref:Nascent polypeptide-associated complex subunit alpha, muscle-specific form-like n=1 Tax=Megalurothrips usitatus TaxID=439358 RepID=A0AAV7XLE1_9NEOP|nr:hypothetical protein ONE63_008508 [Megalurothrips usitatus]
MAPETSADSATQTAVTLQDRGLALGLGLGVPWPLQHQCQHSAACACGGGCCGLCFRGGSLRKYVFLCAACGGLSALLGVLFLAVYFLLRSYTSSLIYFETVPTYVPASMLLSTGLVVMCLARRRNRYTFLMKLSGGASLASAALCVLVTVATTVVHMSRLQSLSQCHYQQRSQTCTCYSALVDATATDATEEGGARYVFNAIPDCDVIHGALYSCLRAMFGLSVVGILVCIFSGMLVYQLFSHEKKKMYWEQLELRCRYLYRRQQHQPPGPGQPLALPVSHHCGSCSCCDDCRDLHTPPPSVPWEFMDSRYWAPGRVGNLYSPNPEDHQTLRSAPSGPRGATRPPTSSAGSAWSWRRLPWGRSGSGSAAGGASRGPVDVQAAAHFGIRPSHPLGHPSNPDSQYGFNALNGQPLQPAPAYGRDPCGGMPFLLPQVYPAPQPHPRPFAPATDSLGMPLSVPMTLPLADDLGLGPQFYLWGPPPPYMSNPTSAANSPARQNANALPNASASPPPGAGANPYPLLARSSQRPLPQPHRCTPTGAAAPSPTAAANNTPGEDAGNNSALDSLSSPEKTVPRKKRRKAGPGEGGVGSAAAEAPQQPDSPESPAPTPTPSASTQAVVHGAHGTRKTKKRTDASVVPLSGPRHGHGARYQHRSRGSHAHAHRPTSADSCCAERSCCSRQSQCAQGDSDDVDTEGYSYPRLKFPPPQPAAAAAAAPTNSTPCDSQAILAAFDNQAFHDGAADCVGAGVCTAGPAGVSGVPGGAAVKTLTLGPQGPLVCKKRAADLNESEVYFGDDSSCCNVSEQHSSLTYEEPGQPQQGRELRAFKLVHTHGHAAPHGHLQQRSMDAALPARPVSVHRPTASTLSDTAVVDPSSHYHLHPIDTEPPTPSPAALRQRMPLPLPHPHPHPGPSLAPDAQYESIADSNVYTYISPLSLGPGHPGLPGHGPAAASTPARRSFKTPCDSPHAAPHSAPAADPSHRDEDNALNAQRETSAEAAPSSRPTPRLSPSTRACSPDERPGIDV